MRAKPTFEEILRGVEDENDARVFRRARLANALAKLADHPRARRRCYAVKAGSIDHGLRKFPKSYGLGSVEEGGRLLGLRWNFRRNLHVPAVALSDVALEWVAEERREIVAEIGDLARAA